MPTHYRAFLQISHNAQPAAMIMEKTITIMGVGFAVASECENEIANNPAAGPTEYPVPINASCVPAASNSALPTAIA